MIEGLPPPSNMRELMTFPLIWYTFLLIGLALFQTIKGLIRTVHYLRGKRVFEPWMIANRRAEARKAFKMALLLLFLGVAMGWVALQISLSLQPVHHVTQAGELQLLRGPRNSFEVRFAPADFRLKPRQFRGKGQRLSVVGAFISCPSPMRWILFPSGHQFLGFHVEKTSMDFTPQEKLFDTWYDRTSLGYKISHVLTSIIPGCDSFIRSSPPIKRTGRYLVFATPRGYLLERTRR